MALATPPGSPMPRMGARIPLSFLQQLDDVCGDHTAISRDHPNVHFVSTDKLTFLPATAGLDDQVAVIIKIIPNYKKEDVMTKLFHAAGVGPQLLGCITDRSLGRKYMFLEYIPGSTLAEHIAQKKPMCITHIHNLLRCIAANGLYHKDLNLNNIMVTSDGLKVIDFEHVQVTGPSEVEDVERTPAFIRMCRDVSDRMKTLHAQLAQLKEAN